MKTVIAFNCPSCGATIDIQEDREVMFCKYCGTKILVNDENCHTYRHIDEADIKRAETERMIRLKEMELEEKRQKGKKILIAVWLTATAVLTVVGLIGEEMSLGLAMFVGFGGALGLFDLGNKKKTRRVISSTETEITSEFACYHEKNYETVIAYAKGSGFTKIQSVPLKDLSFLQTRKNGQVESVTINGCDDFDEGDIFPKDAMIIISYHSTR